MRRLKQRRSTTLLLYTGIRLAEMKSDGNFRYFAPRRCLPASPRREIGFSYYMLSLRLRTLDAACRTSRAGCVHEACGLQATEGILEPARRCCCSAEGAWTLQLVVSLNQGVRLKDVYEFSC